jgi:four helix bundle protein
LVVRENTLSKKPKCLKDSRGLGFKDSSEMLKNYKELKFWQKAYQLCLKIYRATRKFPKEERFGLISQIRRAVVSVVSNIAEGYGRRTTAEYIRSLYIAYGSNCELETQMLLSGDLGYIEDAKLKGIIEKIQEVERMLKALTKSLESNP